MEAEHYQDEEGRVGRHLMKASPRKLQKEKGISESPERRKEALEVSQHQPEQLIRKISDQMLKQIKKYVKDEVKRKQIISMIEKNLSQPLESQSIFIRNPSAWIKSLSSNFTWTNRELEWYHSENRFLFACSNEEDCDRWVSVLNWLIAKTNEGDDEGDINLRDFAE
jgi:hypothetical protein